MRRAAILGLALFFVPRGGSAQGTPLGPEFRVNTFTTGNQDNTSVASDPAGNFVVLWDSYLQDGSARGVFGQRYDSAGVPLGPEFRVNTFTTSTQYRASAATDSAGNFVVVWTSDSQDGPGYGVFGQRYASSGAPLGPEFRVNSFTTGSQGRPAVAADPSGNFVVVWTDTAQDGSSYGVFGQRYASSGAPLGSEFRVNTYTTGEQGFPAVASDPSGNFVVAWNSLGQSPDTSGYSVIGQRYAGSGAPLGSEFRINTYTTGSQGRPSVAADSSGNFVVVWNSYGQMGPGTAFDVFGQRYASSGAPLGSEFRVNTITTTSAYGAAIAGDSTGNFVVAWMTTAQDGNGYGIFGQRFASSGAPSGPEFRVNSFTTGFQGYTSVAANSAGDFVVVWQSYGQDGDVSGVFGQRYGQIVPVELMRLTVE